MCSFLLTKTPRSWVHSESVRKIGLIRERQTIRQRLPFPSHNCTPDPRLPWCCRTTSLSLSVTQRTHSGAGVSFHQDQPGAEATTNVLHDAESTPSATRDMRSYHRLLSGRPGNAKAVLPHLKIVGSAHSKIPLLLRHLQSGGLPQMAEGLPRSQELTRVLHSHPGGRRYPGKRRGAGVDRELFPC